MRKAVLIPAVVVLVGVVAIAGAEMAGWPGLAPRLAARIAPALGLSIDPDTRMHLIFNPRLLAPTVTVARDGKTLAEAEDLDLRWRWGDLWRWHHDGAPLRVRQIHADKLDGTWVRNADGQSNWQSGKKPAGEPTPLPIIESLLVRHGSASVDDAPLQLKADATFSTETDGHWQAKVDGTLRGQKLALAAQASASLALLSEDTTSLPPTQVVATLTQGKSRIYFNGTASSLLDARKLDGKLEVSGPSLEAVGRPLGVTLPHTHEFALRGQLRHAAGVWTLAGAQATVGASKLAGDFNFDTNQAKPFLSGELRGGPLLLADLGPAVGTDAKPSRPGRILPDRPIDVPSLAAMNASLDIHLSQLDLGSEALGSIAPVAAKLTLQDSELRLFNLDAGIAGGKLTGETTLNARQEPPQWQAKLAVRGMALERWLKKTNTLTGKVQADIALQSRGRSTAALLGGSNGTVDVVVQNGTMSHLVTEAAGLDIAQGLGVLIKGDSQLPLDCARLDGRVKDGVLRPQMAVVDNKDSRIELDGRISLATEEMQLRAVAHPKDFSPLTLRAPVRVEGTLGDPHIALEGKKLGGKALAAIALGALTPPAALLAFIDPGEKLPPLSCTLDRSRPTS